MPALSPTMEEGKLAKWLKKEGDDVKSGDVIAEIETDKATMEVEAVDEGTIGKILVAEGTEGVEVNTPIATLLADGEERRPAPTAAAPKRRSGAEPKRRPKRRRRPSAKAAPTAAAQRRARRSRRRRPIRKCRQAPRWSR